ncbi:tetratricopeptide repeat protein [Actinomadura sp. 9N215]|uniref:tetratricopeptide repeat protein n=1 Tax=Actinomadura sp. 9N215 TaxID=3375150 RepID=UPI0037A68992
MDGDARITCVGFSIGGWWRLTTPERIRARVESVESVRRSGRGDVEAVFAAGEVIVLVLRAEPAGTVAALMDVLRRHDREHDREKAGRTGTRIRAHAGTRIGTRIGVAGGSTGPRSGAEVVAESVRLLGRGRRHRADAPFAVLLSDLLHWHVQGAFAPFTPPFQRVAGDAFGPGCWIWSPDVPVQPDPAPDTEPEPDPDAGPRPEPDEAGPDGARADGARVTARAEVRATALLRRARTQMRAGDHGAAAESLRRILRIRPGPEPLLALGECHLRLGERRAAVETWRYLLRRHPLTPAAYPLMDLAEPDDVARAYLEDGLRIVQAEPGLAAEPERLEHDLLLALAARAYRRGEQRAGDRMVNAAADVHPAGGGPLRVLAVEALRRGDRAGASRLLSAALAWEPEGR